MAGASIPDLPRDIIYNQILPRLPVQSLMQFKCVSKSWFSLIRSDSFVTAYPNFHHTKECYPTNFLFFNVWSDFRFFSSRIDQQGRPTPISLLSRIPRSYIGRYTAQSINGLVCWSYSLVTIINPTTKECIELPPAPWARNYNRTYHFGFAPLKNEYKVLQVYANEKHFRLNIFTLRRDSSWRQLDINLGRLPFDYQSFTFEGSVCLHGAIHWVNQRENAIVAFDVDKEVFGVIPMPDILDSFEAKGVIEVGGCVAMYDGNYVSGGECPLVLWVLKDYKNHMWVKETIVSKLIQDAYKDGSEVRPLCTIHTSELAVRITKSIYDVDEGQFTTGPTSLCLYNMDSKHTREESFIFPDLGYEGCERDYILKTTYGNSIVPLK